MNQRDLPWRKTKNAYFIWLSEIIMQQTRIAQGTSYYEKFVEEFSDIFALARADERHILKLWQGLGYYSRARNLHLAAKTIVSEHQGRFPDSYKELIRLRGIGDYTASAIASISFGQPHAVVDGNVFRVLSRIFGIYTPINESKGVKEFKQLAEDLLNREDPGTHNQALMEFGALVCTPKKPKCETCIFNGNCYALQQKCIEDLPVKLKKLKIKKRTFNYFVLDYEGQYTFISQRQQKDIWQNLFEFPLYESTRPFDNAEELDRAIDKVLSIRGKYSIQKFNEQPVVHKLTHQTIYAFFWIIRPEQKLNDLTSWDDLKHYALPVLLQNFVDKFQMVY